MHLIETISHPSTPTSILRLGVRIPLKITKQLSFFCKWILHNLHTSVNTSIIFVIYPQHVTVIVC